MEPVRKQFIATPETGEMIVRHTVTDDLGRVVDDHWRPNYKPRVGDLFDGQ